MGVLNSRRAASPLVWLVEEEERLESPGHPQATRGLLATDHVILNHGQVTWTTLELAPPLLTTTLHQWEDVSALERFSVHRCPTRRVFSGTGLEFVTKPATIRCLYHSATAATKSILEMMLKAGYHGRVDHKKPHISAVNRQKRLDFANEHVNKPPQFWEKVLFSDESKFCIFGIKGRKLVWRKQGTALEKDNLVPTVKHSGGGVMVWGCMAANGVDRLTFIDSTLNHMGYINI
ncbi:transposable element Tcb2 transposase [Trichonephila clavipes]|nr:transposable element Tcb2 transposase [Trichonephila clavipes]